MEALFTSTGMVAIAEIGDKTQLLAIVLTTRFRRPVPIIFGILLATLANHFLAALVGAQAAAFLDGAWFSYLVAASFIFMGLWTLIPDKLEENEEMASARFGTFVATTLAFFVVEIGDKTQLATIALGARYHDVLMVMTGTTLGMMIANVPAVLAGDQLIRRIPMKVVHMVAAGLFIIIGLWMLAETAIG